MGVMVKVDGKILITTIQVSFVLIPSEAGMRQYKLLLKFCHQLIP